MHKTSTISKLRSKVSHLSVFLSAVFRKSKRLTMSKHRDHEQHEIEDIGDVVHDFSNLPDCILHHILSFMPTKEAVKTSVLSTRWKNLWASVPNIDFDDRLLCDTEVDGDVTAFVKFVERALRLRGGSNIKKFRLSCCGRYETSQIHSWISDAIMHNVQELHLGLMSRNPCMIPWSILDTTSLVSLKITTSFVGELPSCISSFPCLKTLYLILVVFPSDNHVENLLLGCPVVEELVFLDSWKNLNNIVISNSTLKSLTIRDMFCFGEFDDPIPTGGCKITIDAANLTYFKSDGFLANEIYMNNASSLVEACIDVIPQPKCQKVVACRAVNLLKGLQHVVSLTLSTDTIQFLTFADNMRARFLMFENLSHLSLTLEIGNSAFGVVMDFLYSCPNLQSICISEGFKQNLRLGENDPIWLLMPTCVSNYLNKVTFKNFHAYDSEVCFLKCILKYARVLEKMGISWSQTELTDVKKIEIGTELETISTTCVVKFS